MSAEKAFPTPSHQFSIDSFYKVWWTRSLFPSPSLSFCPLRRNVIVLQSRYSSPRRISSPHGRENGSYLLILVFVRRVRPVERALLIVAQRVIARRYQRRSFAYFGTQQRHRTGFRDGVIVGGICEQEIQRLPDDKQYRRRSVHSKFDDRISSRVY